MKTNNGLLPKELQQALIEAAKTDPGVPRGESRARIRAVDEAVKRARWRYPQYFGHKGHY